MAITFSLARAERIRLTLRGPAPSCAQAGTMLIGGDRGVNRFAFRGRTRGKAVQPGVYVLTLTRVVSERRVGRPLLVRVVSPRRTILLGEASADGSGCEAAGAPGSSRRTSALPGALLGTQFETPPAQQAPAPTSPVATEGAKASPPLRPEPKGVLGVSFDLPDLPGPEPGSPWALFGSILLIGFPLLLMLALVVRFLRGSWNP